MTWNKCSEKLPEVGMLIVTRSRVEKFPQNLESEEEYKERLLKYYSADGCYYCAGTIYRAPSGDLCFNIAAGEYTKYISDDLEWKEVEKD